MVAVPVTAKLDANDVNMPSFPYVAEITGNDVRIRSGPGTNFYDCGKLYKGDRVEVVSTQLGWSRIVPPADSFSWGELNSLGELQALPSILDCRVAVLAELLSLRRELEET